MILHGTSFAQSCFTYLQSEFNLERNGTNIKFVDLWNIVRVTVNPLLIIINKLSGSSDQL